MNQKTVKLIKKYAYETKQSAKDVKKKWLSLDWKSRKEERKLMSEKVSE